MWTLAKAIQHPQPHNTQTQDSLDHTGNLKSVDLEQNVWNIPIYFFLYDITERMDAHVSIWDERELESVRQLSRV